MECEKRAEIKTYDQRTLSVALVNEWNFVFQLSAFLMMIWKYFPTSILYQYIRNAVLIFNTDAIKENNFLKFLIRLKTYWIFLHFLIVTCKNGKISTTFWHSTKLLCSHNRAHKMCIKWQLSNDSFFTFKSCMKTNTFDTFSLAGIFMTFYFELEHNFMWRKKSPFNWEFLFYSIFRWIWTER